MNKVFYSFIALGVIAASLTIVSLFIIKHRVITLKRELHMINRSIIIEKESIHILQAEWAYLTQPHHISKIAGQYLELSPIEPTQIQTREQFLQDDIINQ